MNFSIVRRSFFDSGNQRFARLDAEYAEAEGLAWENSVRKKAKGDRLAGLAKSYDGAAVKSGFVPDNDDVDYVAIDDVDTDDGLIFPQKVKFGDRPSRAQFVTKLNDILVSTVRPNRGAIGQVSVRVAGSLASNGFALIRPSDGGKYLLAYLRSKFARTQLVRRSRGSMYPAVLEDDVFDVYVPTPPPALLKVVEKSVVESLKLQDEFFADFADGKREFHEELQATIGTPPPSPLESSLPLNVSVCASRQLFADGANRFDAEFFRGEYGDYAKRAQAAIGQFALGDHYDLAAGRSQGRPDGEIAYVRQSALTNCGINWSAVQIEAGDTATTVGRVEAGDLLLACTAHEIYYVARRVDFVRDVPKAFETNRCVADLIIMKQRIPLPTGMTGAYVAAFLRSPWGLHQVQRCIRGVRGGHVYAEDLRKFVSVPVLKQKFLKSFEASIERAEKARNLAKAKMRSAVGEVDRWLDSLA